MSESEPTVFVVDDDPGVRDSIRFLLRSVGLNARAFGSATEFLEAYRPEMAGCLVLDVRMPGMSGLDLQARLQELGSTLPIIFVTAHGDVPMAVNAVKTGALDFVEKPFRDRDLLDRIQEALAADASRRSVQSELTGIKKRLGSLTPRERQVMDLVVAGKANKNIARDLGVSQRTVEIHRARVMEKMGVRSVSMLVRSVMRIGEGD
jgi:two-component system response regulator FixJ